MTESKLFDFIDWDAEWFHRGFNGGFNGEFRDEEIEASLNRVTMQLDELTTKLVKVKDEVVLTDGTVLTYDEVLCKFYEELQREYLMNQLSWLPDSIAHWVVYHWPARWLPELRFEDE